MKKVLALLMISATAFLFSCDNEPLFTELIDSNLQVIIKGTYESNNPGVWIDAVIPSVFMLDIAEIRMNGDRFANLRQSYLAALNSSDPFFNGTGSNYRCNDLYNGKTYSGVQIYFRKMIFDAATDLGSPVITIFREKIVNGFDFNEFQIYTQADFNAKQYNNLVFPLTIELPYYITYNRDKHYVLEIRLFVKENIKQYTGMDVALPDTFCAFDDTEIPTAAGNKYIGGNVRAGVHMYAIGEVASINVSTPSGTYTCAVESGKNPSSYAVPPIVANDNSLENVPIGMRWDIYSNAATSRSGWVLEGTADLTNAANGAVVTVP